MLTAAEVEAIERATAEAVAPEVVHELDGWVVPLDAGTIGRAKAAFPLRHDAPVEPVRVRPSVRVGVLGRPPPRCGCRSRWTNKTTTLHSPGSSARMR